MSKTFDRIKAGLEDAIAFVNGDQSRGTIHTPEDIKRRRKARHREWAKLTVVSNSEEQTK